VGVNYVFLQVIDCARGVVARDHYEVCGVKIDSYACRAERIKEALEDCRGLGAGFDGEMSAYLVCIAGELKAGLLHDLVAVDAAVGRHNADMSGDNICAELFSKVKNSL